MCLCVCVCVCVCVFVLKTCRERRKDGRSKAKMPHRSQNKSDKSVEGRVSAQETEKAERGGSLVVWVVFLALPIEMSLSLRWGGGMKQAH